MSFQSEFVNPMRASQKVLICGSRSWTNEGAVRAVLTKIPAHVVVIHGGAKGADKLAAKVALERGHTVISFPARWRKYGRRAGIIRNLKMLNEKPQIVIAFWDGQSTGTKHTIDEAKRRGIPVEVVTEL